MPGPEPLAVWLYGERVANLREPRSGKLALAYTEEAARRWRPGQPVLSVSMPLADKPYPPGVVVPFFDGLLPEGEARARLERRFGVVRGDRFGLLREIGRDCAGAVVIQPSEEPPPLVPEHEPSRLSQKGLARELADLPERPLGDDEGVRLSLAGQQDKLLLVRRRDGHWARPQHGYPSTHILKPGHDSYPKMVANEAFCLRIARALDLTTVDVEILTVEGRSVLAVSRYDRTRRGSVVERLHQEDFCQALGVDLTNRPGAKYQAEGGPTLRMIAGVLDRWADADDLERLIDVTVFNVAIGNADAHAKNLSLLLLPEQCQLAPLYDTMSTVFYPTVRLSDGAERPVSTALAMSMNSVTDVNAVTIDDILAEARGWPVSGVRATQRIRGLLDRLPAAVREAANATPEAPAKLIAIVRRRVDSLARGRAASAATSRPSRAARTGVRPDVSGR